MARVVVTVACTVGGVLIPKGSVIEVTSAQATAISAAGGSTRASTNTTTMHDTLGEAFAASNST